MKIDVTSVYQYRNMGEELKKHPEAVQRAKTALQKQGIEPNMQIVRGGTDGSRLTEMGLPTPNLTSGQHNVHSYLEWASLEEMAATLEWVLEICKVEK